MMQAYIKSIWHRLFFIVAFAGLHTTVWSQHYPIMLDGTRCGISATGPYFISNMSNVSLPPFSATGDIGKVLATFSGKVHLINSIGLPASVRCKRNFLFRLFFQGVGVPTVDGIYNSSIPNIGIRIQYYGVTVPTESRESDVFEIDSFPVRVSLIKTGPITAQGFLHGTFMTVKIGREKAGTEILRLQFAAPVAVNPMVPTCTIENTQNTVRLDMVKPSAFTGIGSTAGTLKDSYIGLKCSGGDGGTSTKAYVTLTDASQPANRSDVLTLDQQQSVAAGVGIQIMKDGKPLAFGAASSSVGNPNQWFAGEIMQGESHFRIPLQARYVQTAATIKPGSVFARAIFTMSYQ